MQLTTNTRAFIEAEQYSALILTSFEDGLMADNMYRNMSEFGEGETLNIKTIGDVTLQEVAEDVEYNFQSIDTGTITLQITEESGDAWYISDNLREDGSQTESLMAERARKSTRALQENFETKFFAICNSAQTDGDDNVINNQPHRLVGGGANNTFQLKDLIKMRLAFDKAKVPAKGRIFVADPVVEATLNTLVTITSDVTPVAKDIIENGMSTGMSYYKTIYGFDIFTSNYLAVGDWSDGTTTVTNGVANVAMCVLDDDCKPIMGAWRRLPKVEGERNKNKRRDEFATSYRFGLGAQRLDSLGIIITSSVDFE